MLELQQPALVAEPERAVRPEPVGRDDAVARDEEPEPVRRAHRADRPLRVRVPRERRDLAVGRRLPVRDRAHGTDRRELERRAPLQVELEVLEPVARAGEVLPDPVDQRVRAVRRAAGRGELVPRDHVVHQHELADAPPRDLVGELADHRRNRRIPAMSRPGIFRPPSARNEPVLEYAAGSPEREELRARLEQMKAEQLEIPVVIGGEEIRTGDTFDAVMPHDKDHVLAQVHKAGPAEVEKAVAASAEAWEDWHRLPWEERAAVFLRAAELLAGPWRQTLVAATMLNQSKTAHQAEIDAACEVIDFFRFNVEFMVRIYEEQPVSSPGVWNRLEYRPLEGFVFAISPFNFTAIGANLTSSPALMGDVVLWKPASTAAYSSYWTLKLLEEAGLPPGVVNFIPGSGATVADPVLASEHLAGVHFTGSTAVFHSIWQTIGKNIDRYRNYPRIVGETGGKDFIVAHPSADVDAVATAILRGSFEYQGQKCSAASRVYAPSNIWPELKERLVEEVGT